MVLDAALAGEGVRGPCLSSSCSSGGEVRSKAQGGPCAEKLVSNRKREWYLALVRVRRQESKIPKVGRPGILLALSKIAQYR
jgi:hypothetical protein